MLGENCKKIIERFLPSPLLVSTLTASADR
jgi:hypothetical protein